MPASGRTPIETASCADSAASACSSGAPGATAGDRVEDGGQLLVGDLDPLGGVPGGLARGGGDRGDDVARVARDVGEDALVARLAAVAAEVGDVLGQERHAAGREASGVDAGHARVRVRGADERRVQHARAGDVDRVRLLAGDARIEPAHASASIARRTSTAVTRRR